MEQPRTRLLHAFSLELQLLALCTAPEWAEGTWSQALQGNAFPRVCECLLHS